MTEINFMDEPRKSILSQNAHAEQQKLYSKHYSMSQIVNLKTENGQKGHGTY